MGHVTRLVEEGIDINLSADVYDGEGVFRTPLMHVSNWLRFPNQIDTIVRLIEWGAKLDGFENSVKRGGSYPTSNFSHFDVLNALEASSYKIIVVKNSLAALCWGDVEIQIVVDFFVDEKNVNSAKKLLSSSD